MRRPSQESFDLHNDQCLSELNHFLVSSGVPQASIHVEIEGDAQRATIFGAHSMTTATVSGSQHESRPRTFPSPQASSRTTVPQPSIVSSETAEQTIGSNSIYAIGSYTKILINVAYHKLVAREQYKDHGLTWDKSACDLFNEIRRRKGKNPVRRFSRDPTVLELLLHRNAFAPMNRFLLGPDGSFILPEDDFLEIAPLITEDYFKGEQQGYCVYSNANHIFAALILEELMGQSLPVIMQEVVFRPLEMTHTVIDKASLESLETAGAVVLKGHHVHGDMVQVTEISEPKFLADTVEAASLGARSSTEDLAKLIREFLRALDDMSSHFQERDTLDFFGPKCSYSHGGRLALGGLFCALDSVLPGSESLNRKLVPPDELAPYVLGRRRGGSQCHVYYKGGSIDGFSSSVYVSLNYRAFVIVLANSTGPIDVTDHISRFLLQEVLRLSPRIDVFARAVEEGRRASQRLRHWEDADRDLSTWSSDTERFAGIYRHVRYGQELDITRRGEVTVRVGEKSSSLMRFRVSGDTGRIFPKPGDFGIDRWTVWNELDFTMEDRNGKISLIGRSGEDRYTRTFGS